MHSSKDIISIDNFEFLISNINRAGKELLGDSFDFYQPVFVQKGMFQPPELGFFKIITWLYAVHFEVSDSNAQKLIDIPVLVEDALKKRIIREQKIIKQIRTFLFHNLNPEKREDSRKIIFVQDWFQKTCGKAYPVSTEEWRKCLVAICENNIFILRTIESALHKGGESLLKDIIVSQFKIKKEKEFGYKYLSDLFSEAFFNFGMEHLNSYKWSNKYYAEWAKQIKNKTGKIELKKELMRRIEREILQRKLLPVGATDLMDEFSIAPGSSIKKYMNFASESYFQNPCNKVSLLDRVRKYIQNENEHV